MFSLAFFSTARESGASMSLVRKSTGETLANSLSTQGLSESEWEQGVAVEISFWRRWLENYGLQWPEEFEARFSLSAPLHGALANHPVLISRFPDFIETEVFILDCGAGPVSAIGRKWGQRHVAVTPVDPLAVIYSHLLRNEFNLTPPVWTQYAPVERLSTHFAASFFDVVTMINALDHAADPILGLSQMLYVARNGAPVFLSHHRNEAIHENGVGFHQWNFDCLEKRFVIWRGNFSVDVGTHFGGKALVECALDGEGVITWLWKV